jgi:hypothetical protein
MAPGAAIVIVGANEAAKVDARHATRYSCMDINGDGRFGQPDLSQ